MFTHQINMYVFSQNVMNSLELRNGDTHPQFYNHATHSVISEPEASVSSGRFLNNANSQATPQTW